VPFSSLAENEVLPDGSRPPVWFAFDESRPLAFFAGLWTNWTSVRRVKEGQTTNDLYGFVTTEPNAEVKATHPKAMPVILTAPAEVDAWLTAPTQEALAPQRPLPDGSQDHPRGQNGRWGAQLTCLRRQRRAKPGLRSMRPKHR
jgi:putative SOS response-associated peptidase YedK